MIRAIISLATGSTMSGTFYPNLPNGYSIQYEDNSWYSIKKDDNNDWFIHGRLMINGNDPVINVPGKGVFILAGEKTRIKNIYDWLNSRGQDIWTLQELKDDGRVKATKIKNAWRSLQEMSGSSTVELKASMGGYDYSTALNDTVTINDLTGS